ncbi:MAG: glycosyltransferase [Planctomycetaceae bacterium]|nr:glycosyltransferase [Planctomycetaceae bacterium]
MADLVIQRVVFPRDPGVASLYYHAENSHRGPCVDLRPEGRRSIILGQGATVSTDSYFNSFFETYWRRHTTLGQLTLRIRVSGRGTLRLLRTMDENSTSELASSDFEGDDRTIVMRVPEPFDASEAHTTVFFEVTAGSPSVTIHSAEWVAVDVRPAPVRLVAGYCTFNRETFVLKNITALTEDPDLASWLSEIMVVDQGTKKVRNHPNFVDLPEEAAARTSWIDQANYGGAGGFTRCLLEAMTHGDRTHVLLLDDDALVEPESVFRTATFFALAKREFAVGGAMLDLLRPTDLYEAGGLVLPRRMGVGRRGENLALDRAENVRSLAAVQYPHYNAWWFFACPVSVIERLGLPLPMFIRCDDLEFGCRLTRAGIPTVTLPGAAVWHLPFYLKKRTWIEYYTRRNILVAIALHFPVSRLSLATAFVGILLYRLLTLDYFKTWAVCEGMADYLSGPSSLQYPEMIHAKVLDHFNRLSEETLPRPTGLRPVAASSASSSLIRQGFSLLSSLFWQLTHRTPPRTAAPSGEIEESDASWRLLGKVDVLAIHDSHCDHDVVLRRNRKQCVRFLMRGFWLTLRFLVQNGRAAKKWRTSAPRMREKSFWRHYLRIEADESQNAEADRRQASAKDRTALADFPPAGDSETPRSATKVSEASGTP